MAGAMALRGKVLTNEQLENVVGGLVDQLVVTGIGIMANQGLSEFRDLKNLLHSDSYKKMSPSQRERRLGKELANSTALAGVMLSIPTVASGGIGVVVGAEMVAASQLKWRIFGTSASLREVIEKTF